MLVIVVVIVSCPAQGSGNKMLKPALASHLGRKRYDSEKTS